MVLRSALVAVLLVLGCREHEPSPSRAPKAAAAARPSPEGRWWDPDAPQPVRAPEPARKPIMSGGRAVVVAPGTGQLVLVDPEHYLDMLGQGYQRATEEDLEAHNQAARAR